MGGTMSKVEVEEIDMRPIGVKGGKKNDPEDLDAWEAKISRAERGGAFVFSDGSFLDSGNVVGGWRWRPESVTWHWCGTVRLQVWPKVLAEARHCGKRRFSYSPAKAAIAAVKKAGNTGKARSKHL